MCGDHAKNIKQIVNRAKITVVVDGTMVFVDRLQIYRLSLVHGCRAVPLGWIVFLAAYAKHVTVLANRGFRDHDWAELCVSVGWRYRIRVTKNTIVTFPDGRACRIDHLGLKRGKLGYHA